MHTVNPFPKLLYILGVFADILINLLILPISEISHLFKETVAMAVSASSLVGLNSNLLYP